MHSCQICRQRSSVGLSSADYGGHLVNLYYKISLSFVTWGVILQKVDMYSVVIKVSARTVR